MAYTWPLVPVFRTRPIEDTDGSVDIVTWPERHGNLDCRLQRLVEKVEGVAIEMRRSNWLATCPLTQQQILYAPLAVTYVVLCRIRSSARKVEKG